MTWGLEWGFPWGGAPQHYDFSALFNSKRWKQLDRATQYRKLMETIASILASIDTDVVAEAARVGIAAARGDELDDWGDMVGILRNGMDDTLYRRAIKATARKSFGQADPQTIYDMVRIFSDGIGKATIIEAFPANFVLWLHNLSLAEQEQIGALMNGVPGLGIGAYLIVVDPDGVFEWGSNDGSVTVDFHWDSNDGSVSSSEKAGFASVAAI